MRDYPILSEKPEDTRASVSIMSDEILNTELEKGYQEFIDGKTRPAKEVFDELYKEYDI